MGGDERLTFSDQRGHWTCRRLRAALPDGYAVTEPRPGRYRVEGAVTPAMMADRDGMVLAGGILATDLAISRRGLEDVYLEATGRQVRS